MALPKPFERQIVHFDGDSFFASVEQVLDYRLRGKPIVTGGERGAITSASIEAKKLGINRGVPLHLARELCPELIVVPGNYLQYSIFAHRMYSIVREFAEDVEEYSIDECFADITGLDKLYGKSASEIALAIKEKIEASLGITFGVGLAPTKVLAKIASKHRKPGGFTEIGKENHEEFLRNLPTHKIWGVGPASSLALSKLGIESALDFAERPYAWIESTKVSKPFQETWLELNGISVKPVSLHQDAPKSIIVSRTFRPPSTNKSFILSELSKNIESACSKARAQGLEPREFRFYLKTQAFTYHGFDVPLLQATASPVEMMNLVNKYFSQVYRARTLYRTTGVCLKKFTHEVRTPDLFGESAKTDKQREVFKTVDKLASRFGENTVHLGSSLSSRRQRRTVVKKSLEIPILGVVR